MATAEVWREVDEALDGFCLAVCPEDLRGGILRDSALRHELALPRGIGGLGIPHVAEEAPLRAAESWPRPLALAAGARHDLVAAAYRYASDAFGRSSWVHVTMDAHHKANAESSRSPDRRRLEQNAMRGEPLH